MDAIDGQLRNSEKSEGALVSASPIGENTTSDAADSLSVTRILCQSFVVLKSVLLESGYVEHADCSEPRKHQSRLAEHICQ
jgi:hypothetical protein